MKPVRNSSFEVLHISYFNFEIALLFDHPKNEKIFKEEMFV
jgi:hypothetical protein